MIYCRSIRLCRSAWDNNTDYSILFTSESEPAESYQGYDGYAEPGLMVMFLKQRQHKGDYYMTGTTRASCSPAAPPLWSPGVY